MEDAHVIFLKDTWGFFGVLDGHGGDQCSKFIAKRLYEELETGKPADDATVREMMLRLDQEFLDTKQPSGSTATFCVVEQPEAAGGKYVLRVGNIGDSRVLLGRRDGTIVEGEGTDGGLTTDHKPDHPSERERIERTGGFVELVQGVARVNGDLAVSRSFGDSQYKQTGGPAQEDHPVSAGPEFASLSCDGTDFLVLVCDGISEGAFPNSEVVKLAAQELFRSDDETKEPDAGRACAAVVRQALKSGSCDNLSCMIVMLGGGEPAVSETSLLSGAYDAPKHGGFRDAYQAMVEHAGLTLPQALEKRYDDARGELSEMPDGGMDREALAEEVASFADGPPASLASGSAERTAWFSEWLAKHEVENEPDPSNMTRDELIELLERRPDLMAMARQQGLVPEAHGRVVKVGEFRAVRAAVRACSTLKWSPALRQACGKYGTVVSVDHSDDTAQVRIPDIGVLAWFPLSVLKQEEEDEDEEEPDGRTVRVASVEELRAAIEAHPQITWNDSFVNVCGQTGVVIRDDPNDGTSEVRFAPPIGVVAWFPTSQLTDLDDGASRDGKDGGEAGPRVSAGDAAEDAEAEEGAAAPAGDAAEEDAEAEGPEAKRQRVAS